PRDVVENWINTGKINRYDLACTDKTSWQPIAKVLWPDQFAKAKSGLTGKQWGLIVTAIIGFMVLAAVVSNFDNQQKASVGASQNSSYQPTPESPKDAALRNVFIDFKWAKGGFGN